MASPAAAAPTATSVGPTSSTHNITQPPTVNVDELLVMGCAINGTSTLTTPSGWSIQCARTVSTTVAQIIYVKKADGTEGGTTVNVATSGSCSMAAHVFRVTGWGGTLATDVVSATPATGSSTGPDPGSASWSWGSLDMLGLVFAGGAAASITVTNYPSSYTGGVRTLTSGSNAWIASAQRAQTAKASPENPGAYLISASMDWVANTVVIKQLTGSALTGAAVLAGVGAVAAVGRRGARGASVLAGVGALAALPTYRARGFAALAGVGALTAVGKRGVKGASVLGGVGTLTARPAPQLGVAVLAGVGTFSAVPHYTAGGKSALASVGTSVAVGHLGAGGKVTLAGVGVLTPLAHAGWHAKAVLVGVGSLSAAATVVVIVIVPTRQRPRIYIHDGASLQRIAQLTAVTDLNRSYALREHVRTASFTITLSDDALQYTNPRDAHVIWIESSEYPLPWVGRIIDREGKRADRTVTVTADSYDTILGERVLSSDFTTPGATRNAFRNILARLNGMNATGIGVGFIEDGTAAPMSLSNVKGADALDKLAEVAGMEWWLSYALEGPTLVIQANLAKERGADLYSSVVLTSPNGNFEVEGWRENGRGSAYAQTVVGGESSVLEAFTERERSVALADDQSNRSDPETQALVVEAQRVLRFDHLLAGESSFVAPTQRRELIAVREELKADGVTGEVAEALFLRRTRPAQVILGRAYPDDNETWKSLEPGNVVHLVAGDAFIDGYDGPAVVVATQPMEHQRFIDVVLEVA